ncbi:transmembrane emp24 domain-containing protein 3 [Caerostris darwini]|uniref:Transmembrane emp24 domain-containing protein 3 n=2 Tax=Caerostris TaxID=172845 RepID=A0AAV4V1G1_9ARAC|nr:transmembrane emp24 domain-containing protein 3 [Caerostris darwini]GIY64483.1 transmembrane emp24 domain-containing protein 3 [Caerostris extrusa]
MKYVYFMLLSLSISVVSAVELTFELDESEKQCFHEAIEQGVQSVVDFQVLDGGKYDVDVTLEAPTGQIIFRGIKKQADTYSWKADTSGVYTVCFSNEFSTFSHKLVYMDFEVGDEKPLPGLEEHLPQMTKMETSSVNIHEHLNTIVDYQTHHRLVESKGRKYAEELCDHVMYWSILEAFVIILSALCQIVVLKGFFTDKK